MPSWTRRLLVVVLFLQFVCADASNMTSTQALLAGLDSAGGLLWQDLAVYNDEQDKVLLQPFTGCVPNGNMCGILGPSGSGKSTLVSTLAGLTSLPQDGNVWSYQWQSNSSKYQMSHVFSHQVAWLQQKDVFFNMLTVRETLELAAYLELPHMTEVNRKELVQSQLDALNLAHAAGRQVGDNVGGKNQLSGGERRRLSVALELVTEKQLFIADEPTSGLDSSMSVKVVQFIKDLAVERQIPCLCVLHQPRSSIWRQLDSIILMAPGGRVCYAGPREDVLDYLESVGHPCPEATNPAEFLVDLVAIDSEDPEQAEKDYDRVEELWQAFKTHQEKEWRKGRKDNEMDITRVGHGAPHVLSIRKIRNVVLLPMRWIPRFGALLRRSWRQNYRNGLVNLVRFLSSAINAVLLSAIFPTVRGPGCSASSIADRVALLSFGAINMCFIAFMKTITLVAEEKPVVRREQTRQQYSALEYMLAKVLAELPLDVFYAAVFTTGLKYFSGVRISWAQVTSVFSLLTVAGASLGLMLGSWAPSDELAVTSSIPVLVVLMVVGIINPSGVDPNNPPPIVVKLLRRFSPFFFAIESLCLGEYTGMKIGGATGALRAFRDLPKIGGLALVRNGDQVIEALGLQKKSFEEGLLQLVYLSLAYLAMSWMGLIFQQHEQTFWWLMNKFKRRRITKRQESRKTAGTKMQPKNVLGKIKA